MKVTLTIPATDAVSSEYRLAQSAANVEREGLKQMGKTIFRRGKALDPERCFMTTPIDNWVPPTEHTTVQKVVHAKCRDKVNQMFSNKGLAATIALTDTAAGVSEVITYDENEQEVIKLMEKDKGTDGEEKP